MLSCHIMASSIPKLCEAYTVNQLNFAAVKFRGLPISLYFAHFNFVFLYLGTKIFLHKNACSSFMYVLIFKI